MKTTALRTASASTLCILSCDVGMEKINAAAPSLARPGFRAEWEIPNRSVEIRALLEGLLAAVREAGLDGLRVVVEPTGIYHRHFLRIARSLGCTTNLVNAEHVSKMRTVVFGDDGKTDRRDPYAIDAVATKGRLICDRELPEVYQLMRHWSKLYEDAEKASIDAKSRIHRVLCLLFPDFSFGTDFLYGDSGAAIFRSFGLNPHRIVALPASRIYERLRRHSRVMRSSIDRLLRDARASAANSSAGRTNELLEHELRLTWDDLTIAAERTAEATAALESLYAEARAGDPRLPAAQRGVASALALARFFAETGPLDDFESWRQVLKLGGMNLRERKSGRYVGMTKISRAGRARLRSVLNHMALPLVKRERLFGEYYHRKTGLEKMPGKQAMTAVARKLVKMLWGIYHSAAAFDPARVFSCESKHRLAA